MISIKKYTKKAVLSCVVMIYLAQLYFQIYDKQFNIFELLMLSTTDKLIVLIFYSIIPVFAIGQIDDLRNLNIDELLYHRGIHAWTESRLLKIFLFNLSYILLLTSMLIIIGVLKKYGMNNEWESFYTFSHSFFNIDSIIQDKHPFQFIGAHYSPLIYYILSLVLLVMRGFLYSMISFITVIRFRKISVSMAITFISMFIDIYIKDIFPQIHIDYMPSRNTSIVFSSGGLSWIPLIGYWVALIIICSLIASTVTTKHLGFLIGSDEN